MRIVMLGDVGAGKTTYMALMYRFMDKGHHGFQIRAGADQHHKRLLWDAKQIRSGNYPPPTSVRQSYDFTLSYNGRHVSSFTWADYRGGDLTAKSSHKSAAALIRDVGNADSVVVFADAYRTATDRRAAASAIRIGQFVQQAVTARSAPIPVVLGFTKADLVKSNDQWCSAVDAYGALTKAAEISKARVRFTSVALTCGPRPKGVQVPVLWCLGHHISDEVERLRRQIAKTRAEAEVAASRAGPGNSLRAWWYGEESEYRRNLRLLQEAQGQLRQLSPLEVPARELTRRLGREQRRHAPPTSRHQWWLP